MKIIDADQVHAALSYPDMVDGLQEAFAGPSSGPAITNMVLLMESPLASLTGLN